MLEGRALHLPVAWFAPDPRKTVDPAQLEDLPLFAHLSHKKRRLVAQHADEVDVAAGAKLVEQDRLANELFVIKEGTAQVFDGDDLISELGPGDIVGEIGVLQTHKRTATVIATTPVSAVVMYGPELTALRESLPDVFADLEESVRIRLGRTNQ